MNRNLMALTTCLAVCLAGCVEREMTITSEPDGALVFVSDVEVGRTPLKMPFTWYGDYDIILRKDGYKTIKTHANITPPWYEIPPLDLLSAMAPWTYHDRRYLHYKLDDYVPGSDADLLERAERLKRQNAEAVPQ
ncbi:MAG: PEGA domain-containing protein [Planctomycetota bacterium]|nr:PEGA domain-containing protein [Planctomycetota bacterium]